VVLQGLKALLPNETQTKPKQNPNKRARRRQSTAWRNQ